MVFIQKPQSRESTLIFGDGDEAVFGYLGNSSVEGYYLVHARPTPKMRWRKQIQMTEEDGYDKYDGWWKKIYKQDQCLPISFDPDFPMWIIKCDWNGNENTALVEHFVRCRQLMERNRDLERELKKFKSLLSRKRVEEIKMAMHPDADSLKFEEKVKRLIQAGIISPSIVQQPQEKEMETE